MLCLYLTERWRDTFTWSRLWQFGAQLGWSRLSFRRNLSESSPSFRAERTGQSIFREQDHCIILRVKKQCHYVDNEENLWFEGDGMVMVLIFMKKKLKRSDIKREVEPGAWEEGNVELSVAQAQ